ncbi:hypothetical protein F4819DRAFT_492258 [Hypoxylon fuscum]|nr:hypothetical protein F4819DRAFT_492258 [Hypoxylon fuscum]
MLQTCSATSLGWIPSPPTGFAVLVHANNDGKIRLLPLRGRRNLYARPACDDAHLPLHLMPKGHGSGLWLLYHIQDELEWNMAEPSIIQTFHDRKTDSGGGNERTFCTVCGSIVKIRNEKFGDYVAVPTGIVDGDKSDCKPAAEYFCIRKASWLGDVGTTASFAKVPGMEALDRWK